MKHPGSAMFLFAPISGRYSAQTSNTIDTPDGGGSFTMKSVSAASLLRRVVAASALLVAPWLLPRVHPFKFKNFQRAWILIILGMLAFGPLKAQHTTPQGPVDFGAIAQEYYRQQTGGGHGISKTSAISGKFFNGAATGNDFGISVSSAGDVNGDGYSDVIVGATGYNSFTGRAYVFYGGPGMDNTADVIMTGETTGDAFGQSVSSAGDINGDGYSDVIVGAPQYGSYKGRAYIFYGGSSMDNIADVTVTGEAVSNQFGISVSSAGDVNGDGYSDVIVGANGYTGFTGRAYIFYGGSSMDNTADVITTGENTNDYFGISVSSAGDVNGDGYSDVIVGAHRYSSVTGRAYIFYGGSSMDGSPDVTVTGEAANSYFGYSVSSAGDVNGDGYGDVVVGAEGYSGSTGRAYIFYGGTGMDNTADVTVTGETTGDSFGASVSSGGDVNGDGYSDVIVGAPGYSSSTGRAYVFYGGPTMDNTADITLTGETTNSAFGASVASAGDVNGDGYSDVIVGAYGYNVSTGRASLYQNSLTGTDIPDETFTGPATGASFGASVSSAGDVNGDGYSDVVVGASGDNSHTGRAYIFYGGPGMDNTPDVTMTGEATNSYFGVSVSSAGDVNGDGYSDVIVGAYAYNNIGRAYIFYGGPTMDNVADVTLTGENTYDYFGLSVSSAGDVNGDGYSDVIVGAYGYSSSTGRAYIFYGGSTMDNTADVTMTGGGTNDYFGLSVSSAGDVNGDGYSDVMAGSAVTARAYIFYGGPSMDNTADVTLAGETTGDAFGGSVSSAGDVNGDGYGDVIVGANAYGNYTGRAYIFYGGSSMDTTADVTMTGGGTNDVFGSSVSSAGDINGDGYSDVIVGADGDNSSKGRAYIFYGGSNMDNTADVTLTGETLGDVFGYSVSSVGDVNGDGYSDVAVGAWGYSSSTGRAYLYRSSSPPIIPRIASVTDVPYDQGGNVTINWIRSGYDVKGVSKITSYTIERSLPPGSSGYSWEEVASITPHHNPKYSYTSATPYDSMSGTSGKFHFRVTAQTSDPNEYWRSNIVAGYSIDNISPSAPSNPTIAPISGGPIALHWNADRSDPDVRGYVIYRATSPGFSVGSATRLSSTSDTLYVDSTTSTGNNYYYRITTADIHGNESQPTAELSQASLAVQLNAFTSSVVGGRKVELHWSTSSEVDIEGFEVQRRAQGEQEWLILAMVQGHGTTGGPQNYSYTDTDLHPGRYSYRLRQLTLTGLSSFTSEIVAIVDPPAFFGLSQNYPNPFNPSSTIEFDLPVSSHVTLLVYDALGRMVRQLLDEEKEAGYFKVTFDGTNLASGVYFYRMTAGDFVRTKRLLLLK